MDMVSPVVSTGTLAERVVTTPRLFSAEIARQRLEQAGEQIDRLTADMLYDLHSRRSQAQLHLTAVVLVGDALDPALLLQDDDRLRHRRRAHLAAICELAERAGAV